MSNDTYDDAAASFLNSAVKREMPQRGIFNSIPSNKML
jgi:hypothetical protein